MGAFHEGHLSLMRAARAECDVVVVSLFVNPAQFGPNDDLTRYPRDEERDVRLAEEAGVDVLFIAERRGDVPGGIRDLGRRRGHRRQKARRDPDHFRGVATVCLKLFNIVRPDVAFFGQKDAQQAAVLRRMIARPGPEAQPARAADRPRRGRPRPFVAERLPVGRGATAGARAAACARSRTLGACCGLRSRSRQRGPRSTASSPTTSNCSTSTPSRCSPPPPESARPDLIDNVVLEGDLT